MNRSFALFAAATLLWGNAIAMDEEHFDTTVSMREKGADTFYVNGHIEGLGDVDMMVDTGSGYLAINEQSLAILSKTSKVEYVRDLRCILADGRRTIAPVYRLKSINIGGECRIDNVEAAVLPGNTRFILGLSALNRVSPFIFSVEPPRLVLSNCAVPESPAPRTVMPGASRAPRALAEVARDALATPAQ